MKKRGFTIVELALSMSFIAVLLVTIAYLTINISAIYQKGLAMRAVTSTGRQVVEELKKTIAATTASSLDCDQFKAANGTATGTYHRCINAGARAFVYQVHYKEFELKNKDGSTSKKQLPANGIFCTNRYTLIWNTGYALNNVDYKRPRGTSGASVNIEGVSHPVRDYGDGYLATFGGTAYKLVKITNFSTELCDKYFDKGSYSIKNDAVIYNYGNNSTGYPADELISSSEDDLALYDFNIYPPAIHELTTQAFYSGTFILGTLRGNIDITGSGEYCKEAPEGLTTDFAYCSINKFNFGVRAMGRE